MGFLAHVLGIDNLSGRWYGFWSGFFGDVSILSMPLILLRRHNCHVKENRRRQQKFSRGIGVPDGIRTRVTAVKETPTAVTDCKHRARLAL